MKLKFEQLFTVVIITIIVSVFLVVNARAADTVTIRNNPGGDPYKFASQILKLAEAGTKVVIDGKCASACTLYLSRTSGLDVCVTPRARIGFHSSYGVNAAGTRLDKRQEAREAAATVDMVIYREMPAAIKKKIGTPDTWPSVYKGDSTSKMRWIEGKDLLAFKQCK